ncbi:MAG: hypothetical protein LLG04_04940 [Parachlamydia sp.]|nr:hypothetical protein [Parachlamydia sp.]
MMNYDIPDCNNWELLKHKVVFFKTLREDLEMQQAWEQFIQSLNEKHSFRPQFAKILETKMKR